MTTNRIKSGRVGDSVWVIPDCKNRSTAVPWWCDADSVLIRQDGMLGLVPLPRTDEGARWGFVQATGNVTGDRGPRCG
jgi:hypothetical protein